MRHLFKKLSAFLVMLMCVSVTVQAQTEVMTMVVTKKNGDVTRFEAKNIAKVEWTNEDPRITTGTAKAIINGHQVDVPWVRLWENGPKFAEYNVGVTDGKAESYGGYYCWGSSIDKDPNQAYNKGLDSLTGNDDTATNLWGSAWRMPTQAEFQALLDNCDAKWTTLNGVNGCKFIGKGNYSSNCVFFPAAGSYYNDPRGQSNYCHYWSSTSSDDSANAHHLKISSTIHEELDNTRVYGYSVRAVLAE